MYRVRDREYSWLLGDSGGSRLVKVSGKETGEQTVVVPKHRKNVMVYYVGWMLIWTME